MYLYTHTHAHTYAHTHTHMHTHTNTHTHTHKPVIQHYLLRIVIVDALSVHSTYYCQYTHYCIVLYVGLEKCAKIHGTMYVY